MLFIIGPSHFTFHLPPNRNSDTIMSLSEVLSYDHETESQMLRMAEQKDGRTFLGTLQKCCSSLIFQMCYLREKEIKQKHLGRRKRKGQKGTGRKKEIQKK